MGISNVMAHWFERLHLRGAFAGKRSMLELGPQDIVLSRPVFANFATSVSGIPHSIAEIEARFFDGGVPRWWTATRDFYALLGLTDYHAADIDDERSAYTIDLNQPVALGRRFDVITNFGTAEHVFNIANVFKTIHDHLEVGGLALHVLPTRGQYNHGFFNIHSTLYRDMARANGYEIVDLVGIPDFGGQHDFMAEHEAEGERGPRRSVMVDVASGDDPGRDAAFARRVLERQSSVMEVFDYVFAALRKTSESPFLYPQQTTRPRDDPAAAPADDRPNLTKRSPLECRLAASLGPAFAYLNARRWRDAEAAARAVLEIDPASTGASHVLGVALCHTDRVAEGLERLERVCDAVPPDGVAFHNLALVLRSLGRDKDALRRFRQATAIQPSLAEAHFQIAAILRQLGYIAGGVGRYRRVLALDPGYADAVIAALAPSGDAA